MKSGAYNSVSCLRLLRHSALFGNAVNAASLNLTNRVTVSVNALRNIWQNLIALSDNQIGLAALALLAGLLSGLVITLFRFAIDLPLVSFFGVSSPEDYESLSADTRIWLLAGGGALLILIYYLVPQAYRGTGVSHVLLRMERHQGYLPGANTLLQWVQAVIALVSGHSVGREGPAVHLGAGTASLVGQYSGVAHHRLRILAAAGVASAISASFDTPMAGVIFAMEVVLLEYSIRSFVPIILASVAGSIVTRAVFGQSLAFAVPELNIASLWEIPYIILLGTIGGSVAALYILLVREMQRLNRLPLWARWGGLTTVTILISLQFPEVLGIGYDTVNNALAGEVFVLILFLLLISKLFLSAWAAAVSFPAGLIGPTLFMGAALGGLLGQASAWLFPDYPASIGFYTLLGMGAMMGAVFRAPLAALVAVLELSSNQNIIMPAMLAIVVATMLVGEVFGLPSVFQVQLGDRLKQQGANPVRQMLRNTWIARVLETSVVSTGRELHRQAAELVLDKKPEWLFIEGQEVLLRPASLAEALTADPEAPTFDLYKIPADRRQTGRISLKANLQDALDLMQQSQLQWLVVYRDAQFTQIAGVVSREGIEGYYHYSSR
ncbi:MAG: chloride channel protein [Oceanospirillaceae bacterium]|nr:chloride channel protein [Oceanospirillaceae bacterium]